MIRFAIKLLRKFTQKTHLTIENVVQHRQAKQRIIQAIKPIQLQFRANESIHIDLLSVCCDAEKRRENSNASSTTHSIDVHLQWIFHLQFYPYY